MTVPFRNSLEPIRCKCGWQKQISLSQQIRKDYSKLFGVGMPLKNVYSASLGANQLSLGVVLPWLDY